MGNEIDFEHSCAVAVAQNLEMIHLVLDGGKSGCPRETASIVSPSRQHLVAETLSLSKASVARDGTVKAC